jgi:hypothetical protein
LDLADAGEFPAEATEAALDREILISRRNRDMINRALRQPEGDAADIGRLPAKVTRASKFLYFDSAGDPTAVAGDDSVLNSGVIAEGTITTRSLEERFGDYVNVKDFNAVGDDATDDTAAIQAAFDYAESLLCATVVFPKGVYRHTALTLQPSSGQMHVNLLGLGGAGGSGVILKYTGTGGTALTIANNTRYIAENLRIQDGGTGALGLFLTSLTVGSNHGSALYNNVFVTGFTTDVQLGTTDNKAASEITFVNLEVTAATTGVLIQGATSGTSFTTNIRFRGIQASTCTTVLKTAGDGTSTPIKVSVDGFSFSENTTEFDFTTNGMYHIANGYAEHTTSATFLKSGSATATENNEYVTAVMIESVQTNYPASPSNFICQFNQPGNYMVLGSSLSTGSIILGGYDGGGSARKAVLFIEGSTLVSASARIQYRAGSNTTWIVRHLGCGNTVTEMQNQDPDRQYKFDTAGVATPLGQETLQATTSGTSKSWTSLPPGIKRITLMFNGVSLSGTDNLLVQIGDAGGVETTGYISSSANQAGTVVNSTAGFIISLASAAGVVAGSLTLTLINAATFAWSAHGTVKLSTAAAAYFAGEKALSAELDRIAILTDGSDTFDAGAVNILYEY